MLGLLVRPKQKVTVKVEQEDILWRAQLLQQQEKIRGCDDCESSEQQLIRSYWELGARVVIGFTGSIMLTSSFYVSVFGGCTYPTKGPRVSLESTVRTGIVRARFQGFLGRLFLFLPCFSSKKFGTFHMVKSSRDEIDGPYVSKDRSKHLIST